MQNDWKWTQEYYSEAAREKIDEFRRSTPAEDLRDFIATSKYGEAAATALADAARKKLNQNAAPKL